MDTMIEVEGLAKSYGAFAALKGVSFSIAKGEIVGFLGPNGAGKTTTMKILTGFISASAGRATVAGHDVVGDSLAARRAIGYLPEAAPVYAEMRVTDYLEFVGRIRGLAPAELATAIARVAEECTIADRLGQRVGTLSKGYKQRVGLAQALLHQPPILILDEPTSGLDPNQILAIRNLVRRIGQSRTVILSTHILQEVQATCDRVLILNRGELVADAPIGSVRAAIEGGNLFRATFAEGTVRLQESELRAAIGQIPGVRQVTLQATDEPGTMPYELIAERDVRGALFDLAGARGLRLLELGREKSPLEEVFRRLTLGPAGASPASEDPAPPAAAATD
jgi:ABC-2 type transport system ATP-binding protein